MLDDTLCVICYEDIKPPVGRIDSCSHRFCFSCIRTWAEEHATCPLDRKTFTEIQRANDLDAPAIETIPISIQPEIVDNYSLSEGMNVDTYFLILSVHTSPLYEFLNAHIDYMNAADVNANITRLMIYLLGIAHAVALHPEHANNRPNHEHVALVAQVTERVRALQQLMPNTNEFHTNRQKLRSILEFLEELLIFSN